MRGISIVGQVLLSVCFAGLMSQSAVAALRTANWIGGASNNYSDAANWDLGGGEIPINNVTDTFIVNIPGGVTVDFDVMSSGHQVTQLTLAANGTLNINAGRDLEVVDSAAISGVVTTNNSTFLADHASSTLGGTTARLQVSGGGTLSHAGTAYTATGFSTATILSSDGSGSSLDLSALQTLGSSNNAFPAHVRTISATNNGTMDLSGLLTLNGGGGDDRVDVVQTGGGSIDLTSLNTLTDSVMFVTDASVLTLNSITSAQNLTFSLPVGATVNMTSLVSQNGGAYVLPTGGTFNLDSLTMLTNSSVTISDSAAVFNAPVLTNIDHTRWALSGGANLTVNSQPTLNVSNIVNGSIISVDGPSTAFDLSSVVTLNSTTDHFPAQVRNITASNGGTVDFSGVVTVNGATGDDRLDFVTTTGGVIDLSNLTTTTGNVRFTTDAADFTLSSLANAGAMSFSLNAGASVHLPVLATQTGGAWDVAAAGEFDAPVITSLKNAAVTIGNGGELNAPNLTDFSGSMLTLGAGQAFNTAALNEINNARFLLNGGATLAVSDGDYVNTVLTSGTIFSADGAGTVLDLSTLASLSNAVDHFPGLVRTISATGGGQIDLSGVVTLAGANGDDRLDIVANSGGTVDLSELTTISSGNVRFVTDAANFTLPQLVNASAMTFSMLAGSTLDLPELLTQTGGAYAVPTNGTVNAPNLNSLESSSITISDATSSFNAPLLTDIDHTRIALSGGATFALDATTFNANNIVNGNILSADGSGTVLDLSALTLISSSLNHFPVQIRNVIATNDAAIDLSGVQTVAGATGDDRLDFIAQTGAEIDLSALQTVSGNTRFSSTAGGKIIFGDLAISSNMNVIADGNTSVIVTGDLHLNLGATVAITAGAMVQVEGNFSHELTTEANFNGDAGIMQMLGDGVRLFEVAGADLGNTAAASNFGLAQLIVGSATTMTKLVLVDLIDNGNRGSPEALYLLGSGGLDGLQILNGSSLNIGNIPVYALISGVMTDLHSLFAPGEYIIPYTEYDSDGFLILPEPSAGLLLVVGGLAILRRRM